MTEGPVYRTPQESFWAGTFGTEYGGRNTGHQLVASNLRFFSVALRAAGAIRSCLELGANVGMNLEALRLLFPDMVIKAVEINPEAARILGERIGPENVRVGSIFDDADTGVFDLVLVKGVLIHINPEMLPVAYEKIYRASGRFILLGEYYNPSPVAVPYRGHTDRLFKRDFAGELLDRYPDLSLLDYGFAYRRDPAFPQDDITWFLLKKNA
jgi:spore coat polysaccharide biosynthesis protein SpsF